MFITQINLNHNWAAQDLFIQHMAEFQIDVFPSLSRSPVILGGCLARTTYLRFSLALGVYVGNVFPFKLIIIL